MTSELKYLACTALLTALLWIPYVVCQVQTNGFLKPENYKDPTVRPMPLWGHRAHRAYLNSVETLAPFAVLVIIAELEGKTGAMTAVWAMAFFWIRLGLRPDLLGGRALREDPALHPRHGLRGGPVRACDSLGRPLRRPAEAWEQPA